MNKTINHQLALMSLVNIKKTENEGNERHLSYVDSGIATAENGSITIYRRIFPPLREPNPMLTQPFTTKLFTLSSVTLLAFGLVSCGGDKDDIATVTHRYVCGQDAQGTYVTYAETPGGSRQAIIRWKSEYFSQSGWTPQARCEEVSPKFDQASINNQLNYITNDTRNNLPIVCAAIDETERCGMMLFTLRPEDDPDTVRQMLIDLGQGKAMVPIPQSGSDKVYIPMREVLKNLSAE